MSLIPCPQCCVNNLNNVFSVFTLCFVKKSDIGYWKRMMVMHEDVCNHWLGAGCREEIRTLVPSVSPCHTLCAFSNKISRQKEMFCQCQWEIQFQRRKKSNYFVGERTKTSVQTKATTNALPLWMQWPVFPTSNMSIGAIQNMTNRPWLKQAYNGLLVLVIKCFHLLQKFQIFLAHHLFHSGSTVKDPKQIWHFWSAYNYHCTKLVSFTIPVMTNWQKFVVPNKWFPCLGICWVACNRDTGWSYSISKSDC